MAGEREPGMSDDRPADSPLEASVVVATRNRSARLSRLLASLEGQRGVRFEVIVVDDASDDSTPLLLAERSGQRLDLRVIRLDAPLGPGRARNEGWRTARADLIVFTDDDCVAEPHWLASMVATHRARPRALLQGRTFPDPHDAGNDGPWARTQSAERLGPYFQTCNIAYPRALLDTVGGFDAAFSRTGEDTDLACRARKAGAKAVFVPSAAVRHAVHPLGPLDLIRRSQAWSDTVGLVKRHPHLRREYFTHLIFWKLSHERVLAAVVGALLARRTRGASLILLARYLRMHRGRHAGYPEALASLPAHALVDLAEVVAMVRGSVRFRTLAL